MMRRYYAEAVGLERAMGTACGAKTGKIMGPQAVLLDPISPAPSEQSKSALICVDLRITP
jgi:hypothetical protein